MQTHSKLLAAAGLLCLAALLLYALNSGGTAAPTTTATRIDPASTSATALQGDLGHTNASDRVAAAVPAATVDPWLDHPDTVELEVRVIDPMGLPVAGHTLRLSPFGCAHNEAEHSTGPDGTVLIAWRTRQPTVEIELVDPRNQLRRVTLTAERRTQLTVLGKTSQAEKGRLRLVTTGREMAMDGVQIMFTSTISGDSGSQQMRPGLHPHAVFTDGMGRQGAAEPTPAGPELSFSVSEVLTSGIRLSAGRFDVATDGAAKPVVTGSLAGTVFGEDGKPAAKVPVVLLGSGPQPLQRGTTDDAGAFRFDNVLAGEFVVRAGGDREGLATTPAVVTTGTTPTTLQLRRGACVRGSAVDMDGKAIAGATVEWRSSDGSWSDATATGDDGSFLLANLPGGPGSLLLFAPKADPKMPIAIAPSVLPDTGEVRLQGDVAGGSTINIEPVRPTDGTDADAPLTIRAWQAETGLGMRMPKPESGDVWSLPHLPAGDYDVYLQLPGGGRLACGRHWLDGKSALELGRVDLPRGGSLHLAIADGDQPVADDERAVEVSALRADVDVRIAPSPTPDRDLWLPTGQYVLAYKRAAGGVAFERFTIEAGHTTIVPAPK